MHKIILKSICAASFFWAQPWAIAYAEAATEKSASADKPSGYPAKSVLLFVASWCRPCHQEIAQVQELAKSAQPVKVLVVPFDITPGTLRMIKKVPVQNIWLPSGEERESLKQEFFAETVGLPFSVMIDGTGKSCARINRSLTVQRLRQLIDQCQRLDKQ
jgi:thiol-disulfide isomerase/thioredoxin